MADPDLQQIANNIMSGVDPNTGSDPFSLFLSVINSDTSLAKTIKDKIKDVVIRAGDKFGKEIDKIKLNETEIDVKDLLGIKKLKSNDLENRAKDLTNKLKKATGMTKFDSFGTKDNQNRISINDILSDGSKTSKAISLQWNNFQRKLMGNVKKATGNIIPNLTQNVDTNDPALLQKPAGPKSKLPKFFEDSPIAVLVDSFSVKAIQQLTDIFGLLKFEPLKVKKESKPGWLDKLLEFLAPLLLALGGIWALWKDFWGGGPLMGLEKLLTRLGLEWVKNIGTKFGEISADLLKGIKTFFKPVSEEAVKAVKIRKAIKPVSEEAAKAIEKRVARTATKETTKVTEKKTTGPLARLFSKMFGKFPVKEEAKTSTKVVTAARVIEDMVADEAKQMGQISTKKGSKSAVSRTLSKAISTKFLKICKYIPGIGFILSLGFAEKRFRLKDIEGGLMELLSGIVSTIPVLGTGLSLGIDAWLAIRDIQGGGPKELGKGQVAIWKQIGNTIWDNIKKFPLISNILGVAAGFRMIVGGQWKKGLIKVGRSIPGMGIIADVVESGAQAAGAAIDDQGKFSFRKFMDGWAKGISEKIYESLPGMIKMFFTLDPSDGIMRLKSGTELKNVFNDMFPGIQKVKKEQSALMSALSADATAKAKKKRKELAQLVMSGKMSAADATKEIELMQKQIQLGSAETTKEQKKELEKEIAKLKRNETMSTTAHDFISRPGKPIQKFSSKDTIIGTKGDISFKEGKSIDLGIQKLQTVMQEISKQLNTLVNINMQTVRAINKPKQQGTGIGAVPEIDIRNPAFDRAYGLRTKVWEILHGV